MISDGPRTLARTMFPILKTNPPVYPPEMKIFNLPLFHTWYYIYIVYNIKLTVYILFFFPLVICSTLQLDIHVFEPKVEDCWGKTKLPEERCHAHQAVVVYM